MTVASEGESPGGRRRRSPSPDRRAIPRAALSGTASAALRRLRLPPFVLPVGAVVAYFAIAALAYWPVEPFSRSQLLGCACSDPIQEVWFLAWPAFAIRHGANPFFTTFLEYPRGVNLSVNTSMPLLGLLGAPMTWLRGPVATFNGLMRFSFAISATSMYFVVRRFTAWWPAAFLAGLLYGFSPYMVGQGFGHLFLTFVPLPPLIALCTYLLVRDAAGPGHSGAGAGDLSKESAEGQPGVRRRTLRRGLLLGTLCGLQSFISIEVLVTTVICTAVVLAGAAIAQPRLALEGLAGVARGIGAAAALSLPVVAYPIWFFLRGPQHILGPPHAVSNLAPIKADLFGPVVPT